MKNLKDSHCFRWLSFVISSPDNQRLAGREQRIEGSVQREALRLRTLGTISGWKTKDRHQKTEGRLLNIESRCSFKLYLAAQGIVNNRDAPYFLVDIDPLVCNIGDVYLLISWHLILYLRTIGPLKKPFNEKLKGQSLFQMAVLCYFQPWQSKTSR